MPRYDHRVPQELAVFSERRGLEHRIVPSGELDLATVPLLEREFIRVEQTDAQSIVVDLGGLTFMESAGVHLLLRAAFRSRVNGSRLRLTPPASEIQRMFPLIGIHERLPFLAPNDVGQSADRA